MDSAWDDCALPQPGCPIGRSSDQRPLSGSPKLIAACHVLHRLLAPRHSPCALSSLTMVASIHALRGKAQPQVSYHALALRTIYPSRLSKTDDDDARHHNPVVRRRADPSSRPDSIGADGGRTHDLRLAKPALSQLSYSPSRTNRLEPAPLDGGPR